MSDYHFILVDDDADSTALTRIGLERYLGKQSFIEFTDPLKGLTYFNSPALSEINATIVLFLDLNMPEITGWEFLEQYKNLPVNTLKKIKVYILSSSLDSRDINKAKANPLVNDYITKPLNRELVLELFG